MMKRLHGNRLCLCTLTALLLTVGCAATGKKECAKTVYEPTWESLEKVNEAPEWFRDAKFGIYFHWVVYSVPAYGSEWYPRNMHRAKAREYKHHVETWGKQTEFGYPDFVPMWQPSIAHHSPSATVESTSSPLPSR